MKNEQLDATDYEILRTLKTSARDSYREVAAKVGLSPASLIERVKRLEKSGVLTGYTAKVNYFKMGMEYMGVVHIGISHGALLKVQEQISKLRGVVAVYDVTGEYDSIAIILCRNRAEFSALLKKLLNIPNVESTNTHVVLNVVKDPVDFADI